MIAEDNELDCDEWLVNSKSEECKSAGGACKSTDSVAGPGPFQVPNKTLGIASSHYHYSENTAISIQLIAVSTAYRPNIRPNG